MSLTELQLPVKNDFYSTLKNSASELNNLMRRLSDLAAGINKMGVDDLDDMGVPTGQIRSDMVNFKTAINELVAFYKGDSTNQTVVPATVVDSIRPIK